MIQAAELLRATLALDSAEIWTGSGGQLGRVVSVPHAAPASLELDREEEAVVVSAGFAGAAGHLSWRNDVLRFLPERCPAGRQVGPG